MITSMVLSTCPHYENYVKTNGFEFYDLIVKNFIGPKRKIKQNCICFECPYSGIHLHACLHCIFFGCNSNHMEEHSKQSGHILGVQLKFGFIKCVKCDSYVYHDDILDRVQYNLMPSFSLYTLKMKFQKLIDIMKDAQEYPDRQYVHSHCTIGLRGLLNLGNTCFMNCIIQTLMHTPVLRDYFFSEKHTSCNFEGGPSKCLVCELYTLYQEFYSGKSETLLLHRLLALIWKNAEHLAGYEQQDAHEFFMTMLNILHKHCTITSEVNSSTQSCNKCSCIVHKVFAGLLQSDVVCQSCWSVSTKVEQFTEISLNISASHMETNSINTDAQIQILSLVDCLEQFTRAEHLGSTVKIECSKCNMQQESTKQLTVNKLPIVICFHLKRFEHSNKFHKKISTPVQFPEELNMGPFTTEYRNAEINGKNGNIPLTLIPDGPSEMSKYNLFSVVNHHGSIDAGHYTSYIRLHEDTWYKCNDEIISKANLLDVLRSEG
ncbi:hypothetical protein PGB90_000249 [Kerria lacca]